MKRPVLRYHGGKWRLADWIISHFPAHKIYVEAYGGAASVLLRKPRVFAEIYNDLDGEVVNVFRVLRDSEQAVQLTRLLELTPFAREEFHHAREAISCPVERARRAIVRAFMGFGSAAIKADYRTNFRCKSFRSGTSPAWDWRNYPACIAEFVERLRGVAIENRPALQVIQDSDGPEVLFYLDPPYPHECREFRRRNPSYAHEMSDNDHRELAATVQGLTGMVIVSGYPCQLYEEIFSDWTRLEKTAFTDGAKARTEALWFNPAAWAARPGLPFAETV